VTCCPELTPERLAALALSLSPGVGARTYQDLAAAFGSAARAFRDAPGIRDRNATLERAERTMELAKRSGARLILTDDEEYPIALHDLPDAPPLLFAIGTRLEPESPRVAIVGTRRATAYGERIARALGSAVARAGATVVSGMAIGIDAAAHRGALDAGGSTIAVLGTGVDVAYPARHAGLHAQIGQLGTLLSEELPRTRATPGSFPKRNRLIAALAKVTIIVEAGEKSGALITASHALDLGRSVACVPGNIDSPQSAKSNELIRDGAQVVLSIADVLVVAGLEQPADDRSPSISNPAEAAVWKAISDGPCDMDTLVNRTGLPTRECVAAVSVLELRGAVECELSGLFRPRVR